MGPGPGTPGGLDRLPVVSAASPARGTEHPARSVMGSCGSKIHWLVTVSHRWLEPRAFEQ